MSNDIYDALVRHQIYLEGYKAQLGSRFDPTAKAIEDDFRRLIGSIKYEKLDDMTKAEVRKFIANLKDLQLRHYDDYYFDLLKELKAFTKVDHKLLSSVFGDKSPFPVGLYDKIKNLPIGGVGEYIEKLIRNVGLGAIVRFEKIVLGAWSNGETKSELLVKLVGQKVTEAKQRLLDAARTVKDKPASIVGKLLASVRKGQSKPVDVPSEPVTPKPSDVPPKPFVPPAPVKVPRPIPSTEDTVGGLINQARAQNQSAINTALQHLSQGITEFIAEKYSNYYQWISVLDSRTTEICRDRAGRVYEHGEGPVPPAHMNCRSMIVPWYNRGDIGITPGERYRSTPQ